MVLPRCLIPEITKEYMSVFIFIIARRISVKIYQHNTLCLTSEETLRDYLYKLCMQFKCSFKHFNFCNNITLVFFDIFRLRILNDEHE